jgi:alkanesulfonate monooxygenase SsuD/methylene tetrahydromethanopterin reductase-like flavin-dependent oxidoreductase (luciferase family)
MTARSRRCAGGERIAFDNPETLTLMGALAAWTDRVRLVTTVMVPQLHDPVMLAKAGKTGTGRSWFYWRSGRVTDAASCL